MNVCEHPGVCCQVLSLTAEAWERSASSSTTSDFGFSSVKQPSECTQSWKFGPPGLAGTTEQVVQGTTGLR